jgi:hypothetical protein
MQDNTVQLRQDVLDYFATENIIAECSKATGYDTCTLRGHVGILCKQGFVKRTGTLSLGQRSYAKYTTLIPKYDADMASLSTVTEIRDYKNKLNPGIRTVFLTDRVHHTKRIPPKQNVWISTSLAMFV